ncbi:MAG: tetratricopeptide repeat protein [Bacteroidales bacterium]|nr:tetratricopeptide repeat protein [Bacteroidales bacterium]MCF8455997.1 tetratricopeptide repeat protein [Bacteroidales bacterium]
MTQLKSILTIVFLHVMMLVLAASNQSIDSLISEVNASKNSRKKVEHLIELARQYQLHDNAKAYSALDDAIQIAQSDNNNKGLADAYFVKAEIYQIEGKNILSIDYYTKAISQYELLSDGESLSEGQRRIAALFEARGELNQALEYFLKALGFYESNGDVENQVTISLLIGNLFRSLGENESALPYFTQALHAVEKTDDPVAYAFVANNLGLINEAVGKYNQALDYYFLALRKYKNIEDEHGRALVLANIAVLNYNKGEIDNALNYFSNALELNIEKNDRQNQALNYLWIGRCLLKKNQLEEAKENLTVSLAIAREIGFPIIIRDAAELLAQIYELGSDFEHAFGMQVLFKEMYDSISSEKNIKERARIELQYQFEKQQKEKDADALHKSDRQLFFVHVLTAALLIVLLLVFLTTRIYILKRRANEELSEKNNIIQKSFDDVKSLSDIGKSITAKLNVEEIIAIVYHSLRNLMDTDVFAIGLYNAAENRLDFSGAMENNQELPYFNYDLGDSNHLASLCFNSQKEIIIYNYLEESKKYLKKTPKPRAGGLVGSMIYLPLNYKEKKIGVITVQSLKKNAYQEFHVNYLQNLAAYIAIAFENARTYSQLEVQNKFNLLLKSTIPNPMFFKDREGVYRDCNPAFLQFIGKSREEVIGHTVYDVAPFELADIYRNKDEELFREKKLQIYEGKIILNDGSVRHVRFYKDVLWTDTDVVGGILGVILDITDFKHNEDQLLVFKELAEASGQGFCIADKEKQIFYVNPTLHEMINEGSGDKLEGKKIGLSFPGHIQELLYNEIFPELTQNGQWTGELERISRSGRHIPTIENFFIIGGNKENGHFIANISTNISHQKEIERSLKESQQKLKLTNKTKDSFFSIISHDLKSPFNSILGFASLLQSSYDDFDDDERKLFIGQLHETTKLTYGLIEDLLTWTRAQSGQLSIEPEVFDLFDVVSDVLSISEFSSKSKKIDIQSTIQAGHFVRADKNITSTVLRNLVSNGIKFTPRGGRVSVSVSSPGNSEVHICVEDTGVGISGDDQQKLFKIEEKFVMPGTEREMGTGMGLKLCKELVELNQGKLWVESQEGQGSRFYFSLPAK